MFHKVRAFIFKFPLLKGLLPGWPDAGRLIAQIDSFKNVISGYILSGRCLDAGCGERLYGHFLKSFIQVSEIINVDLNLSCINLEKETKGYPRQRFVRGSLLNLPFRNDAFDCCLCSEVIEHIKDDTLAISELGRVIKSGGLLLISVPTPLAPRLPGHVRLGYTLDELNILLTKTGFAIKKYTYCFYTTMKILINLWQWQFSVIGRNKRSYLPRFFILLLGFLDRYFKLGKSWDLVILAQRLN